MRERRNCSTLRVDNSVGQWQQLVIVYECVDEVNTEVSMKLEKSFALSAPSNLMRMESNIIL
jgi:hypothetical protein